MMKKKYTRTLVAGLALTAGVAMASNVLADLRVNVMPSGISGPVDSWDSGPYTWPANTLELWGNVVYDGADTLTYTWDFGAGEGSTSGTVGDRNNIATSHAYPNGSFIATLTVTDGTETDSDTVSIDVVPQSLGVEKNLTIQKALRYQYQTRVSTTVNGEQGYYWHGQTSSITDAALAVLAFENHGHLGNNDADEDIYAETVQGGLNYMFAYGGCTPASATDPDSDINGNGEKCYLYTTNLYELGINTMAVAGSASPSETVGPAGSAAIAGKTYQELLEDMVDYIAYAQEYRTYYSGYGGWRYGANYGSSDNSVTQWPVLALGEAERAPWNINAPAFVKTRMASWLDSSSQASDGGFGYTNQSYRNVAKTGAGIAGLAYAGLTDVPWYGGTKLSKAIDFIDTYWNTYTGGWLYHYHMGYHYATYAVKKGMEFADQPLVGARDWQEEYDQWYVDHQYASGSWPNGYWIGNAYTNAAFGLLVLAPLEICKPIADAGVDQEASEGDTVVLDGTGSTMSSPGCANIVSYEWDCEYDGVTFSVDDTGAVGQCVYAINNGTDTQDFTAALRVTDDHSPAKTDIDTATITITNGNVAPVADPGGPYSGGVGTDITLDGSASSDINACDSSLGLPCLDDFIASYQWDLDGDGLYGTEDSPAEPEGVSATVNFGTFIGTKTIGLKVTDSFGRSAAQSADVTTVALSDLFPASYELVSKTYNRRTRMWTVSWRMNIYNDGNAEATEVSAYWTADSIPVGVTVLDDTVSWTDPDDVIDPGETQLSGDADPSFSYSYSRYSNPPDLTQITWDIEFTDALGTRHVVRGILQ